MKNTLVSGLVSLIVALVVGLLLVHTAPTSTAVPTPEPRELGSGSTYTNIDQYAKGLTIGNTTGNNINGTIPLGQNQATWKNTTGRPVIVDLSTVYPTATASTSMRLSVGTTSAATIADNYTNPYSTLIDNYLIATSTVTAANLADNIKDGGTNGQGAIYVPDGTYVFVLLRQDRAPGTVGNCTGGVCESATSTARGYALKYQLHYNYQQ